MPASADSAPAVLRVHSQWTIRPLRPGEEEAAMALVRETFTRWVAPCFSPEGVAEFLSFATAEALAKRLARGHFCLAAQPDGRPDAPLDGLVEVRDASHVCFLFVRTAAQRQGLARRLLAGAARRCRELDPAVEGLTVNASPNSREAYLRLGFAPTGEERTVNGITSTPLRCDLGRPGTPLPFGDPP